MSRLFCFHVLGRSLWIGPASAFYLGRSPSPIRVQTEAVPLLPPEVSGKPYLFGLINDTSFIRVVSVAVRMNSKEVLIAVSRYKDAHLHHHYQESVTFLSAVLSVLGTHCLGPGSSLAPGGL